MPAVEALGFGLPVLTTRCAALPEVTLGLAHYMDDPLDANEMADRIIQMLDDPHRYAPPQEAITHLRKFYAPERIAEAYRTLLVGY